LTDGKDGGSSDPVQVARNYGDDDIPVYTVALGDSADEQLLREISNASGGTSKSESDAEALNDIFTDIRGTVSGTSTFQSTSGTVNASQSVSNQLAIDGSTDSTTIRIQTSASSTTTASTSGSTLSSVPASEWPSVELYYPNGSVVPYNTTAGGNIVVEDSKVEYSEVGGTVVYRIDDPESGKWSYRINNTQSTSDLSYQADVTASTSTTLDVVTSGSQFVNGSETPVTATLVGPNGGISGANVTANVTFPSGATKTVTLTERAAGQYSTPVTNTETGTVNATVRVRGKNFSRQGSVSWSVTEPSTVLQVSNTNTTTPNTAQGGSVVSSFAVSLPSVTTSTSDATGDIGSATATDSDDSERFINAARELAASDTNLSSVEGMDSEVVAAARELRNENGSVQQVATGSASPSAAGQDSLDQSTRVIVSPQNLTGPQGTTIPASNVRATPSVLTLSDSSAQSLQLLVRVPDSAPAGTYNGSVTLLIDGSVVESDVSVNVTEAAVATYKKRISSSAQRWRNAGSSGKDYYETQIADDLTQIYFDANSTSTADTSGAGGDSPQSQTGQPDSGDSAGVEVSG